MPKGGQAAPVGAAPTRSFLPLSERKGRERSERGMPKGGQAEPVGAVPTCSFVPLSHQWGGYGMILDESALELTLSLLITSSDAPSLPT